jgi:hypothetical protein
MESHLLSLRYDGLDAGVFNGIGTAGSKQVIAGAQVLLGAHGHFFTEGAVPDRILDRTTQFVIRDMGRRRGSWIADISISIIGAALWDMTKFNFTNFVYESYSAAKEGRLFEEPPYERRRRQLGTRGESDPIFDWRMTFEYERRRLFMRTKHAVTLLSAPLGITASTVEIAMDGYHFDTLMARQVSGDDISQWLSSFREQRASHLRLT